MSSKKHRDALVKALDDAKIATDASPYEMIVSLMKTPSNAITFSYEDLPPEGRIHNHPLLIQAIVRSKNTSCVMVDDGSAINVCPLRLLHKFDMNVKDLKESNVIIRAYGDSKKPVVGTFEVVVTMGDIESVIEFTVLDIPPTFTLLPVRPWFYPLGVIPSTVHQKSKFPFDVKVVTIPVETNNIIAYLNTVPLGFQISVIHRD